MNTKDVIYELRTQMGLSQDELAEKVFVTRQAVSRWENGETTPNTETLKHLSKLFEVSINTLLGSPVKKYCRCGSSSDNIELNCEKDGGISEDYCKACYVDSDYTLDYLKYYATHGGQENLEELKRQIIDEFNSLPHIEGFPKVEGLNLLPGSFVNLEYKLPGGQTAKFLDDNATYFGNQLESTLGGDRCFGILASLDFLLVCTYGEGGSNPELILYKKR